MEAKLRDIVLRQKREEVTQPDALRELETLSAIWRGDSIEVKALQLMAALRRQAAPPALVAVHPLPELRDITEKDIREFCDTAGLLEPTQSEFVRVVLEPPAEARVTIERMQEHFERYLAEFLQQAGPKER